jgi:type 1 glutamine amidotransferase
MKRALIVWGGLELHEPERGAKLVGDWLEEAGFAVVLSNDYEVLGGRDIASYDLVLPQVTGGELSTDASVAFCAAVEKGVGVAAFHHGLATSFPDNPRLRFLSGSTFASHPGDVVTYQVEPLKTDDPVMVGIGSFSHTSEQYYLHVDPSVEVLATTTFSGEHAWWKKGVEIPVVFKSRFGEGRVFYSALGHKPHELADPSIATILKRGMAWAAR